MKVHPFLAEQPGLIHEHNLSSFRLTPAFSSAVVEQLRQLTSSNVFNCKAFGGLRERRAFTTQGDEHRRIASAPSYLWRGRRFSP